ACTSRSPASASGRSRPKRCASCATAAGRTCCGDSKTSPTRDFVSGRERQRVWGVAAAGGCRAAAGGAGAGNGKLPETRRDGSSVTTECVEILRVGDCELLLDGGADVGADARGEVA